MCGINQVAISREWWPWDTLGGGGGGGDINATTSSGYVHGVIHQSRCYVHRV